MSSFKVSEATFKALKQMQEEGDNSRKIAHELNLKLPVVNIAMKFSTYTSYERNWDTELRELQTGEDKPLPVQESTSELITEEDPAFFKPLLGQGEQADSQLKESRLWLLEQIYYLRKACRFFEARKEALEDACKRLERQVSLGIEVLEQLQDNKRFTKLSKENTRKNM